MFKNKEDLSNYSDEQIYEHIKDSYLILGSDDVYEKYRDAVRLVREYEQEQREVAKEIWNRLKDYEGEGEEDSNDYVLDVLNDLMYDSAGNSHKWDRDYQEFWIPSNC